MGQYLVHTGTGQELVLEHHGIKGQRWGVRRFQNPDGTYTEEGKKRYSRSQANTLARNIVRDVRKKQEFSPELSSSTIDSIKKAVSGKQRQHLSDLANTVRELREVADRKESEYYNVEGKLSNELRSQSARTKADYEKFEQKLRSTEEYANYIKSWNEYYDALDGYNQAVENYAKELLGAYADEKVSKLGRSWNVDIWVRTALTSLDGMQESLEIY